VTGTCLITRLPYTALAERVENLGMVYSASVPVRKPTDGARRPRRWAGALAVVVALVGATLVWASPAQASSGAGQFISLANSARSSHGVKTLATNGDLNSVAQHQAQRMADSGQLAHNPNLTSDIHHWLKIGENVGYGPDVESIQNAFMRSAGHRANILDSDFTEIGVGVVVKKGVVWVSEVFRQPDGTSTPTHQAKPKPVHHPKKHKAVAKKKMTHPVAKTVAVRHRTTPQSSKATTSPKPSTRHPSASPTPTSTSSPRPSAVPAGAVLPSAQPSPTAAEPSSSASPRLFAMGPTGPRTLGSTQSTGFPGGSSLPTAGALGLLAVLGLAISLRVRSNL
jgi:uncharacterized protein YkwD